MSVARGFGLNGKSIYMNVCKPEIIECNFVVDSTNGNGLGLRSLKSNGYIENVFMNIANGAAGTPALGTARTFAILGASAVTNTGASALTGNLGIFPGTSITGFPPGTFTGVEDIANVAAQNAQTSALAAYTDMHARSSTVIATALDGQTLTPGVYSSAGGTFTLAGAGVGTVTLNGAGVYIFQTATTLTTGAGGVPTMTLAGGARASDVYFVVGSSATINSGNAGTFNGNIIALTSITDTSGGTVNGSLIALNGAVTLSAASNVNSQALVPSFIGAGNPNPAPGYVMIRMKNNFNYYLGGFSGFVSPLSGTSVTSVTAGQAYVIVSVGTTTLAQWLAVGLPAGFTPTVGQSFIATATQAIGGTGAVQVPSFSGINSLEVIGDPNQLISNSSIAANAGAILLVQFLSNGVLAAPKDGSVCAMSFWFDGSSVTVDGL